MQHHRHQQAQQPSTEWAKERQALLAALCQQFSGTDWLQLSQTSKALVTPPRGTQLHIEAISYSTQPNQQQRRQRLTDLPACCADLIVCDPLIQQHPQPELLAQELSHLLRPGGQIALSGAGSLRGRMAARISNKALNIHQVLALFSGSHLQATACYHHGSQIQHKQWRQQLQQWNYQLKANANQRLPWLLPLFLHWAATRPGWVLILKDRRSQPRGVGSKIQAQKLSLKPAAGTAATGHCRQPTAKQ